jgi:bifunctional DNA-binding transcriptional regulator/antitoxin component of YhaV-PrlF toxin-antitoxin module
METFRVRIAARRQITLPGRVLELLHLDEGDVLEISVEGGCIRARGLKLVPTNLFTPELLEKLEQRDQETDGEAALEVADSRDIASKLRPRRLHAGSHV